MTDDELNDLFDNVIDPESQTETENAGDVNAPSNKEEINSEPKSSDVSQTKDKVKAETKDVEKKRKPEMASNSEKTTRKTPANKQEKKPSLNLNSIKRKIKGWYISITADTKKKREAQADIPLKDRKFLENFPFSFKTTLLILFSITLLVLLLCFLFMPQFRVLKFEIEGNITISNEELILESGIEPNSHLYSSVSGDLLDIIKLDYGKVEDQMKANNPYIKDIQITASFPSTIKMTVVERNKISYIKMPDGYAVIDDEGVVIELVTILPDNEPHAVICGLDVSGAAKLEKIDIKNYSDYQKSLLVLGAIITADDANGSSYDDYSMFENTKEIRIIPGGNIFLTIVLPTGSELHVKLNSVVDVNEDMALLRRAIVMNTFDGLPDGSFDMTGDEYIYRKYN